MSLDTNDFGGLIPDVEKEYFPPDDKLGTYLHGRLDELDIDSVEAIRDIREAE